MQSANFKCPKTNEEFFITKYRTVFNPDGSETHKDAQGRQIINPVNNEPLQLIITEIDYSDGGAPAIGKSIVDQKNRNAKYFKQRAIDHGKSEEQRHLKNKRFNEELKIPQEANELKLSDSRKN